MRIHFSLSLSLSLSYRGKKNYLPPASLQMGFGILFRVADECIPNHIDERKPKFLNQSEVRNVLG
jgi:hypothetical protein